MIFIVPIAPCRLAEQLTQVIWTVIPEGGELFVNVMVPLPPVAFRVERRVFPTPVSPELGLMTSLIGMKKLA
jgi:hypothetical protein